MVKSVKHNQPGSTRHGRKAQRKVVVGLTRDAKIRIVTRRILRSDPEYKMYGRNNSELRHTGLVDYYFAADSDPCPPDEVFDRLRWGGVFVYVASKLSDVMEVARKFTQMGGFVIDRHPGHTRRGMFGLPIKFLAQKIHYFVARKVYLIKPGESSDRFTYHVQLVKRKEFGDRYVVMKQVPSLDRVISRLREKFPDVDMETLRRCARKFTDKIFPVFLTRETAMLNILQRDLPEPYCGKVPGVVDAEKDEHDFVKTLYVTWLRNGGDPISQLEFARQGADLLQMLHDKVGVIHLDLRLDNFVITPNGVGFVDFGSSVRVGEVFAADSLLSGLFEEMMRTSQIQRMLGTMSSKGLVTNRDITACHQKVDKAVDFFYLAVQINAPHSNPDFRDLVKFDPASHEAELLKELTNEILRPDDKANARFKSAKGILEGIDEVARPQARSSAPAGKAARTPPPTNCWRPRRNSADLPPHSPARRRPLGTAPPPHFPVRRFQITDEPISIKKFRIKHCLPKPGVYRGEAIRIPRQGRRQFDVLIFALRDQFRPAQMRQ